MKIKRIKQLKVNVTTFKIVWDSKQAGASFSYRKKLITIGVRKLDDSEIAARICHELLEICALEMHVRHDRSDCIGEYLFVYDHRQHSTKCEMFISLFEQFIV